MQIGFQPPQYYPLCDGFFVSPLFTANTEKLNSSLPTSLQSPRQSLLLPGASPALQPPTSTADTSYLDQMVKVETTESYPLQHSAPGTLQALLSGTHYPNNLSAGGLAGGTLAPPPLVPHSQHPVSSSFSQITSSRGLVFANHDFTARQPLDAYHHPQYKQEPGSGLHPDMVMPTSFASNSLLLPGATSNTPSLLYGAPSPPKAIPVPVDPGSFLNSKQDSLMDVQAREHSSPSLTALGSTSS